ncbi:27627_t:CDS:2, partial [Racocetra persica]
QIPESELLYLKNVVIKELQKRLKNHHHAVGKQVFSLHCSENAFVGLFGAYITRYLPCSSFYICNFKGEDAVDTIGSIFNNNNWYKRHYGNDQKQSKKSQSKLSSNGEMIIEWKVTGFKDKENHEYRAGVLQIRFFLDQ